MLELAHLVTVVDLGNGGCVAAAPFGVASQNLVEKPNLLPRVVIAAPERTVSRPCRCQQCNVLSERVRMHARRMCLCPYAEVASRIA